MGWGKLAGGRRLVKENLSPFERKIIVLPPGTITHTSFSLDTGMLQLERHSAGFESSDLPKYY